MAPTEHRSRTLDHAYDRDTKPLCRSPAPSHDEHLTQLVDTKITRARDTTVGLEWTLLGDPDSETPQSRYYAKMAG